MLSLILIMFASLALTKMDCNRIANYMMVPVFLGLAYIDLAYYKRASVSGRRVGVGEIASDGSIMMDMESDDDSGQANFLDRVELLLGNGLGFLAIVQLTANLFLRKLSKVLS